MSGVTHPAGPRWIPLGRWCGVPVGARWSVGFTLLFLDCVVATSVLPLAAPGHSGPAYWVTGAMTAAVFELSLLVHELAHAVAARRHGVGVRRVELWALGGTAEFATEPPTPRADLVIAAAGPLAGMAVAVLTAAVALVATALGLPPLVVAPLVWLALADTVVAVVNLVPAAPLDGGRVLRAALWSRTGDRFRADRVATGLGLSLGAALVVAGLAELLTGTSAGVWAAVVGGYLVAMSLAERRRAVLERALAGVTAGEVMEPDPVVAPGWWTVQAFLERVAARERRRVFPVVSFEHAVLGVVSLAELTALPLRDRLSRTVARSCRPLDSVPTAHPEDPAFEVLWSAALRPGRDVVVVLRGERLAGVVDRDDVDRVVELSPAVGPPRSS